MSQESLIEQAKAHLEAKEFAQARALYLQVAEEQGLSLDEKVKEAEQKLEDGEIGEAVTLFTEVVNANPTDERALVGVARGALSLKQVEQARHFLGAAMQLAPEWGLPHTLRGVTKELEGDLEPAIEHFQKGYKLSPDEFLCAYNYGRILSLTNEPVALGILERAVTLAPENYDGYYLLGVAQVQRRQFEAALASFKRAAEIAPEKLNIHATLADVYMQLNQPAEALKLLHEANESIGPKAQLFHKMADLLVMLGKGDEALVCFDKAIDTDETYAPALLGKAHVLLMMDNAKDAEKAAKEALALDEQAWPAFNLLGQLYTLQERRDEAKEAFRASLLIRKDQFEALGNLAALLIDTPDASGLREARSLLEDALPLAPQGEFRFHFNLALVYSRLGMNKDAAVLVDQIVEGLPANHDLAKAAEELRRAAKLGSSSP